MKAISTSVMLLRLAGMVLACFALPPLLCFYVGSAAGLISASAAAALWYSQYRLPSWTERGCSSFWFVAAGYSVIGLTLFISLARLL